MTNTVEIDWTVTAALRSTVERLLAQINTFSPDSPQSYHMRWSVDALRRELIGHELTLALLSELVPVLASSDFVDVEPIATSDNVTLLIPYSLTLLRSLRQAIGSAMTFSRRYDSSNGDGDSHYYYRYTMLDSRSAELSIWLRAQDKRATCKRVQIGEKIVPIYQTVCDASETIAAADLLVIG